MDDSIPRLTVTSSAFDNLGTIPDKYTGRGEDISPDLNLPELSENAVSIAIILDDTLNLDSSCGKSDLIEAMEGHIIQYGTLTGRYPKQTD